MSEVQDVYSMMKMYENAKSKFLNATRIKSRKATIQIHKQNKKYAEDWLNKKESRLQKENGQDKVSRIRNAKTLYKEIVMLYNVLYWFNDYDLKKISDEELSRVFDELEKGIITSKTGKPLSDSVKKDYYSKVFRGDNTFFGFLDLNNRAKKFIIRKFTEPEEVRFFDFDTFKIIAGNAVLTTHKICFWLMYDTGIEINAILQLTKSDFIKEGYRYKVKVGKDISKKSRQKRYIYLVEPETMQLLDNYLENLKDDDRLFNFTPPAIYKALKLIVRAHKLRTRGDTSKEITLKDFRSSCATRMLNLGLNPYQVNVRLGHKISSSTIDRYISYLGLDQEKEIKQIENISHQEQQEKINELLIITQRQKEDIKALDEKFNNLEIFDTYFYDEVLKLISTFPKDFFKHKPLKDFTRKLEYKEITDNRPIHDF